MVDPDATRAPRLSREMRGRLLFLVGATVFAAAVGFAVSRIGGSSSPGTTLVVSTAAARSGHGATTTTPSSPSAASEGYDGPAICSPTTNAATSGGSPQQLTRSASEVASGTIEGKAWSLWSAHGQSGAAGIEDGGLVFDGREYGLCAGYPNPSETEMIDTGGDAIIYGVVDYPGLAKVQVGTGAIGSLAMGTALPSPHVSVVDGVSFYIGTLPHSSCSYSYFEINTTSPSYSTEHNIGFGGNGVGQGYSITNNPGNAGACVTGKLDPLSYSEGVWQLPPGQFPGNGAGGSLARLATADRARLGGRPQRHLELFPHDESSVIRWVADRHHLHGNRGGQRDGPGAGVEPLVRQGPVRGRGHQGRRPRPRRSRLRPVPRLSEPG